MSGVKARKWVLRSHFAGMPKREDLEIVEEELPPIKDGGEFGASIIYKGEGTVAGLDYWARMLDSPKLPCHVKSRKEAKPFALLTLLKSLIIETYVSIIYAMLKCSQAKGQRSKVMFI